MSISTDTSTLLALFSVATAILGAAIVTYLVMTSSRQITLRRRILAGCAAVAVGLLVSCIWFVQTYITFTRAAEYAQEGLETICVNLEYQTEPELCRIAEDLVSTFGDVETARKADFTRLAQRLRVDEVNLVDTNGIVIAATIAGDVGVRLCENENGKSFAALNRGEHFVTQEFRRSIIDPTGPMRKYVGIAFPKGGFIQVGDSIHPGDENRRDYIFVQSMQDEHISDGGYFIVVNPRTKRILSTLERKNVGMSTQAAGLDTLDFAKGNGPARGTILGRPSIVWKVEPDFFKVQGYVVFPLDELLHPRNVSLTITSILLFVVFVIGGSLLIRIMRQGECLRAFYADEASRRQKDLLLAKDIQASALPSIFPPYPDRKEVDLYAVMRTAKEVGGDFYDFFWVDHTHLCLVIADVSDKGVPAALFMMRARATLQDCINSVKDLAQAVTKANDMLCNNNVAGMFVTAWVGVFDLEAGGLEFVSAGHNPPFIRRAGGLVERLAVRPSLVLAGMEGARYKSMTIPFAPGDAIFLYTDGVSEAVSATGEFFTERRLKEALTPFQSTAEDVCRHVISAVDSFAVGAPQADDITVLSFRFRGQVDCQTRTFPATIDGLKEITKFLDGILKKVACSDKAQKQLLIATDEIVSNIIHYSGASQFLVSVSFPANEPLVNIEFSDAGKPYNPLEHVAPDVNLPAQDRDVGGLGLFMVKSMMDHVGYSYVDGRNVLTLGKNYS